jgi:branched-chain amino acid transport system ATP-binding protein
MTATVQLRLKSLRAWYGQAQVLHDVSLEVRCGEVIALMGRNGAGKSTTLKAIAGLMQKVEGTVEFRGALVSGLASYLIARQGLGYVPEERRIFTELTVRENLEVGRQPSREGVPAWNVEGLLELFPNLASMLDRSAGLMSGGEQQMLAVARSLMGNPYCVLLDEPSEGLAPNVVEDMARMVVRLKAQGLSVLLSEQNLHFARWVSDRAYVLEKGEVRFRGTMDELARNEMVIQNHLGI